MELIFLDTETTGDEIGKDRLCQVCFKTSKETRVGYFKPPVPVSVKSMSINHITNKMLTDKEAFAESQMKEDLQKLLNEGVFVAHNARFDVAMLEAEGVSVPKFICTLRVARHLDKDSVIPEYGLQYLRYYLGLEVDAKAHDAEGDVKVLQAIFHRLFSKMKEGSGNDEEVIEKMIKISSVPSLFVKFNFGKYNGEKIEDILKSDRGYLEWLLNQKLASGEDDEDWIYTLRYYLKN